MERTSKAKSWRTPTVYVKFKGTKQIRNCFQRVSFVEEQPLDKPVSRTAADLSLREGT